MPCQLSKETTHVLAGRSPQIKPKSLDYEVDAQSSLSMRWFFINQAKSCIV